MKLNDFVLELSSKPFVDESDETARRVLRTMFTQWKRVIDDSASVSVLFWLSDGSEILDYDGNMETKFEWAYWIGCAEALPNPTDTSERGKRHVHYFPKKYLADAGPRPYGWLKRVAGLIKEIGREVTGKTPRLGAIFDNGPEFSISDFKYRRHREILVNERTVVCDSHLHADRRRYAAFPDGIPEGTTLGVFFGRQFRIFARDFGYDYIWLSNGMGFGHAPWSLTGPLFDGNAYYPERADVECAAMLEFWRDFTAETAPIPIETRGSNYTAGVELASNAAPLQELYNYYKIAPPVNSPWAALNFHTGREIAAWMSHVAELPGTRFPFRFYAHDPWYLNSPWLDRYGRKPWDIYAPLSITRIDENGKCVGPNSVSLLTVDDTYGRMPDRVPDEVIPFLRDAFDNAPDKPGPFVWVYPFREYSDMMRGTEKRLDAPIAEETFLGETLQGGMMLNTVVSTRIFRILLGKNPAFFRGKTLLIPLSLSDGTNETAILNAISSGINCIFYGSLKYASDKIVHLLGLAKDEEVSGAGEVSVSAEFDHLETGAFSKHLNINPLFDCGGLRAAANGAEILCSCVVSGQTRVLASSRVLENGVRVSFANSVYPGDGVLPSQAFPCAYLMRRIAALHGWSMKINALEPDSMLPRVNLWRHDNEFFFHIYARDTTCALTVETPYGAPVCAEMETIVERESAKWHSERSSLFRCRVFVKQNTRVAVTHKTSFAACPEYLWRDEIGHLIDAEVRFFPPESMEKRIETVLQPENVWRNLLVSPLCGEEEDTPDGKCLVYRHVTGRLFIAGVVSGVNPW